MKNQMLMAVAVLCISFLGGVGGAFVYQRYSTADLPVAIVDFQQIAASMDRQVQGQGQAQEGQDPTSLALSKTREIAQRLADQGFIVIESGYVISAPKQYYVGPGKE